MRLLTKVMRDLWIARSRVAFMVLALAAGLTGLGAVLSMRGVLRREMTRNYLDTVPASATIDVGERGVSAELLAAVRRRPEVAAAERRATLAARWRRPGKATWSRALLFVAEDYEHPRLARARTETGLRTPPPGTVLVERSALPVLGVTRDDHVEVSVAGGPPVRLRIVGVVHDPALAPAPSEQAAYLYASTETLTLLGRPPVLDELRVLVARRPLDPTAVREQIVSLAKWLQGRGVTLHDIRIPPPGKHPHEAPSNAILLLLVLFAAFTVVLGSVLSASLLSTVLARQVREIGVLKTLGATRRQLLLLYLLMVVVIALLALLVAALPTVLLARVGIDAVSTLLNFDIASYAVPGWAYGIQIGVGLVVPLLTAAPVVFRASRVTVRQALDDHGARAPRATGWERRIGALRNRILAAGLRNALRAPRRLALTLGLLAVGGGLCISAASVAGAWSELTARVWVQRSYDVEVRLAGAANPASLKGLPGIRRVETWGSAPVTLASASGLPISRTYPDGGHGSFHLVAAPDSTKLVRFRQLAGRWLEPGETQGVVLNQLAAARVGDHPVGREITLVVHGRASRWRVVGVVEEVAAPATAYVSQRAFSERTGQPLRTLRVALTRRRDPAATQAASREIQRRLRGRGQRIAALLPLKLLFNAMGEHVSVLVRMLLALALLMAVVGVLSLASTMSTSVVERTRELGVLRAIGARPAQVRRLILVEGLFVAVLSLPFALLVAAVTTWGIGHEVGLLAFKIPLPFGLSWIAVGLWSVGILLVTAVACLIPARTANRRTVRDALSHV